VMVLLGEHPDDPPPGSTVSASAASAVATALRSAARAVAIGRSELGAQAADELLALLARATDQVDLIRDPRRR
jgi:hypothetical protein